MPGGNVRVSIQVQHAGLPGIGYDMSANAIPGRNWINRSGSVVRHRSRRNPGQRDHPGDGGAIKGLPSGWKHLGGFHESPLDGTAGRGAVPLTAVKRNGIP